MRGLREGLKHKNLALAMLTNLQRLFIGGNFIERLAKENLRGLPGLQVKVDLFQNAYNMMRCYMND